MYITNLYNNNVEHDDIVYDEFINLIKVNNIKDIDFKKRKCNFDNNNNSLSFKSAISENDNSINLLLNKLDLNKYN